MAGYKSSFAVSAAALLLFALSVTAQQAEPAELGPPTILTVTPGNGEAVIGFAAPRGVDSPEVLSYVVSCEIPGDLEAGVLEVTSPSTNGNRITVQGLTNGEEYVCTMIARAAGGGILPRAVSSAPSNPTPAFSPSIRGGATIFVGQAGAGVTPPTTEPAAAGALPAPVVTAIVAKDDAAVITFDPATVAPGGAPITGYTASCQSNNAVDAANDSKVAPVDIPADSTEAIIPGLSAGEWTCSVAARTASGLGPATSQPVVIKAAGPEAVVPEAKAPEAEAKPEAMPVDKPVEKPVEKPAGATATEAPVSAGVRAAFTGVAAIATVVALFA